MSQTRGTPRAPCALVGLGASVAAAYTHYHMLNDPTYRSFCDVSATVSCTQVYQSRFGTLRGIPVAIFGALFFVAAALLSVAGLTARPQVRESVPGYLFVMSTLALAVVLYLGLRVVRSAEDGLPAVPDHVCRGDRALPRVGRGHIFPHDYIASPCLPGRSRVPLEPAGLDRSRCCFSPAPPRRSRSSRAEASPAAAAAGAEGAQAALPAPTETQKSEFERWYASQPRVPLIVPAEGAKVLVVKFNDYQCPACGQSYTQYKPIFAKYEAEHPGAVRLVMKDYPLNRDCNDALGQTIHPAACDAAVAVRLAPANKREAMEEWLYAHQPAMTPPSVRQAARDIGQITDFEAKYPSTLAPREERRRARPPARREVDADLLHQRREDRGWPARRSTSIRRSRSS